MKPEGLKLPNDVNVRTSEKKIRRPSRIHTADSSVLERYIQATAPKPSLTNMVPGSTGSRPFFDWRPKSSNGRTTPTDSGLTTTPVRRRFVSVDEVYHVESNQQSIDRTGSVSTASK